MKNQRIILKTYYILSGVGDFHGEHQDLHSALLASLYIQERLSKQAQNSYVSLARFI